MKISELIKNNEYGAYVLGTVFAFKYKRGPNYYSVMFSKNQKKTNHIVTKEMFEDQLNRIDTFYGTDLIEKYSNIKSDSVASKDLKNSIGFFAIIENDIEGDIAFSLSPLVKRDRKFALNFIRGVIDARSSADKTTGYVAMDIKKSGSISFASLMISAFNNIFDKQMYNINPRFKQPSKISRLKNPQFRIPYTVIFGRIGTFRIQFLDKLKQNKNNWPKFEVNTIVPNSFDSLIIWDTTNVKYNARNDSSRFLNGDVDYINNYTKDNEGILYALLKEKYPITLNNKKKGRQKFSEEILEKVLSDSKYNDFLEPSYKIELSKTGKPILDIHHIIPYEMRHIFSSENDINDIRNLIPLRQDTHYILHRGAFHEKKLKYLTKLYEQITPFLKEKNILKNITFDDFKTMY